MVIAERRIQAWRHQQQKTLKVVDDGSFKAEDVVVVAWTEDDGCLFVYFSFLILMSNNLKQILVIFNI